MPWRTQGGEGAPERARPTRAADGRPNRSSAVGAGPRSSEWARGPRRCSCRHAAVTMTPPLPPAASSFAAHTACSTPETAPSSLSSTRSRARKLPHARPNGGGLRGRRLSHRMDHLGGVAVRDVLDTGFGTTQCQEMRSGNGSHTWPDGSCRAPWQDLSAPVLHPDPTLPRCLLDHQLAGEGLLACPCGGADLANLPGLIRELAGSKFGSAPRRSSDEHHLRRGDHCCGSAALSRGHQKKQRTPQAPAHSTVAIAPRLPPPSPACLGTRVRGAQSAAYTHTAPEQSGEASERTRGGVAAASACRRAERCRCRATREGGGGGGVGDDDGGRTLARAGRELGGAWATPVRRPTHPTAPRREAATDPADRPTHRPTDPPTRPPNERDETNDRAARQTHHLLHHGTGQAPKTGPSERGGAIQ